MFHSLLRSNLADLGHTYTIIYSALKGVEAKKADSVDFDWATKVDSVSLTPAMITWQDLRNVELGELNIIVQENKQLNNYWLQLVYLFQGRKVAFFGHGKNFQATNPNSHSERWKRFWATKVHWWFVYTDRCADIVAGYGFPRERITVFNNSIDMSQIDAERRALDLARVSALREQLVADSHNVGVYVGGLYKEKRLEFLVSACDLIRASVPDFHLIVIGTGKDAHILKVAAESRPWLHILGPKFGMEKTELVSLGKVWLMPGLVGLAILDSFAYELPLITTDLPFHSPEIDYLEDGVNGLVVCDSDSESAYADAVTRLLLDENARQNLVKGGIASRDKYSIEEMARRFADGVSKALAAPISRSHPTDLA
jgi:glycosyltransferase involved in cell wall biosynthesis